jgi:DNA-binding protein Fis
MTPRATHATPIRDWIQAIYANNITHAAKALGVNRSTLHRVMNSAYVINGKLYTIKRKSK